MDSFCREINGWMAKDCSSQELEGKLLLGAGVGQSAEWVNKRSIPE